MIKKPKRDKEQLMINRKEFMNLRKKHKNQKNSNLFWIIKLKNLKEILDLKKKKLLK